MATTKTGLLKLKQNEEYTERISSRLLDGEQVIDAYKSMRDGVVLANNKHISKYVF